MIPSLSAIGFKILLDIMTASPRPLKFLELPYTFRLAHRGREQARLCRGDGIPHRPLRSDVRADRAGALRDVLRASGRLVLWCIWRMLWVLFRESGLDFIARDDCGDGRRDDLQFLPQQRADLSRTAVEGRATRCSTDGCRSASFARWGRRPISASRRSCSRCSTVRGRCLRSPGSWWRQCGISRCHRGLCGGGIKPSSETRSRNGRHSGPDKGCCGQHSGRTG